MTSESDSVFEIESETNGSEAEDAATTILNRTSPLAIAINEVLVDAAADAAVMAADMQKKKKAAKAAAKYVVKIASNSGSGSLLAASASEEMLFRISSVLNTIARLCLLGIGKQFAEDMIDLRAHELICSIMRRPSMAHSVPVQTAGCHAMANMLALTKADARKERQKEFILVNAHVAVTSALSNEGLIMNRDCVLQSLRMCSLLAESNKSTSKRLRKCGAVGSLQNILAQQSLNDNMNQVVILNPAKKTLQDLWFGAKKKRGKGTAPGR